MNLNDTPEVLVETIKRSKQEILSQRAYFALAAAILYFCVKYALGWVLPFIIGFIVGLLVRPLIVLLAKKLKIPRQVSAVVLVLLVYAIVAMLIFLIGANIVLMLKDLFAALPQMYTDYIAPQISDLFEQFKHLTERLDPQAAQAIQDMTSSFADSSGTVVSGLSSKVLGYLSNTVISLPALILFIVFSIISSVFLPVTTARSRNTSPACSP